MSRCLQREVQRDNSARRFVGNFSWLQSYVQRA